MGDELYKDALLSLLRSALFGQALPGLILSDIGWIKVYKEACRQSVEGVVFDAVSRLSRSSGLRPSLGAKWISDVTMIRRHSALMDNIAGQMAREWESAGIKAVLMKGPGVAALYPDPALRMFGDLDWWFPEKGGFDAAVEMARALGATLVKDSDGDMSYGRDGIIVELHRHGYDCSSPESVLMMLVDHIFHHFCTSGVGLRQLCDLAVAYSTYTGRYDRRKYLRMASAKGLSRWTIFMEAVLSSEFCMDSLDSRKIPSGDIQRFMSMVWEDGNFGMDKERRFSGVAGRACLSAKYAPSATLYRWVRLTLGHLLRKNDQNKK